MSFRKSFKRNRVSSELIRSSSSDIELPIHPYEVYKLAIFASLGAFMNIYELNLLHTADYDKDKINQAMTVSLVMSTMASIIIGFTADIIGRKKPIVLSSVLYTVGYLICGAFGNSYVLFVISKAATGFAAGLVQVVVPVYVSECAPKEIRGYLIAIYPVSFVAGFWMARISAATFQAVEGGWRVMIGLAALVGIIQIVGVRTIPESPRWHVMKGNISKAEATLQRLRDKDNVDEELEDIVAFWEEHRDIKGFTKLKRMFSTRHVRYALFVGLVLRNLPYISGIDAVFHYNSHILENAGFEANQDIWVKVFPLTVIFLAVFQALWKVDTLGRKKLLAVSLLGMAIASIVMIGAFLPVYMAPIHVYTKRFESGYNITGDCLKYSTCYECSKDAECGFCSAKDEVAILNGSCVPSLEESEFASQGRCAKGTGGRKYAGGRNIRYYNDYCPTKYSSIAIVGLILFLVAFPAGAMPMPWTINAEIYPLWCRSTAFSLATVFNTFMMLVSGNIHIILTRSITSAGAFAVFAIVCVGAACFAIRLIPETKEVVLEEIELLFMTPQARQLYLMRQDAKKKPENYSTDEADGFKL